LLADAKAAAPTNTSDFHCIFVYNSAELPLFETVSRDYLEGGDNLEERYTSDEI